MTRLQWHAPGAKKFEQGVDRGVLFVRNDEGVYGNGVPWNGLTSVSRTPSGAEASKQYADNTVYATLISAEEFAATIEAFYYPDEFEECDGTAELAPGVTVGQQNRRTFGFTWRALIGDDLVGTGAGYKIHVAYGLLAAPSEKADNTINDSPELEPFSWEVSSTPIEMPNGLKPSAIITVDSTKVTAAALEDFEDILYGTVGTDPRLPTPEEVYAIFEGAGLTVVTPTKPTQVGDVITIPSITGVEYYRGNTLLEAGAQDPITEDVIITAKPAVGYKFPEITDEDWLFETS